VLGIPVASLFETAPAPESNVVRRADVRGVSFGGEGVENLVLSPRGERRAQVIETHVAPGGSPGPEPWSHSGDLIIATVLEGTLEFRFEDHTTAPTRATRSRTRPPTRIRGAIRTTQPRPWRCSLGCRRSSEAPQPSVERGAPAARARAA